MDFNIHAGMRVLYKKNGNNWLVGEIAEGTAIVNNDGIYIPVWTKQAIEKKTPTYTWDEKEYLRIHINDIFFDAFPIDDWVRDYPEYFTTKENYIKLVQSEDFDHRLENAYVSDGEYGYYPVSKYNKNWLEKQPFDYIVRGQ